MRINKSKDQVIVVLGEVKEIQIILNRTMIEWVNSLQYLGIIIEETGYQEMGLNSRIEKVN